jgi:hypothetical protein
MPLELFPDNPGDPRNARFMSIASGYAYSDDSVDAFRETLGLDAKLISVNNTQVYVGQNENHIVAAFRGSQAPTSIDGLKDWLLTNANDFLILPEGDIGTDFAAAGVAARFHRGFLAALADVWDPLYTALDAAMKAKERPLWITGHSLGGALALVAAWRLQQKFIPIHAVITFGAPMVCNEEGCKAYAREFDGKIFRYVDNQDLVPRLPTISLIANAFAHVPNEISLGAATEGAATAFEYLGKLAGSVVDGILSGEVADKIWDQLKGSVTSHLMPNYQSRVAEKCD